MPINNPQLEAGERKGERESGKREEKEKRREEERRGWPNRLLSRMAIPVARGVHGATSGEGGRARGAGGVA
jgi:hypothetical protein